MGFLIGTLVRIAVEFRVPATPDGLLTDPTVVTFQVHPPGGAVLASTYQGATAAGTIVKDAVGQYHADYLPLVDGAFPWRWAGTGAAHAPVEGSFTVDPSRL